MVLASAHARRRVIPVVLTALVMLFGPALAQYSPAQEPATEDQAKMDRGQELLQDQARLRAKYQEFEDSLIQLANAMQATDPARAELLRKAFAQAKEREIGDRMATVLEALQKDLLTNAVRGQNEVETELQRLFELLLSESRPDRLADEKARLKEYLKRVKKLIRDEEEIRGLTERGGDLRQIAERQGRVAEETGRLGGDIARNEGKAQGPSPGQEGKQGKGQDDMGEGPGEGHGKSPNQDQQGMGQGRDQGEKESEGQGQGKGDDQGKGSDDAKGKDPQAPGDMNQPGEGQGKGQDDMGKKPSEGQSGDMGKEEGQQGEGQGQQSQGQQNQGQQNQGQQGQGEGESDSEGDDGQSDPSEDGIQNTLDRIQQAQQRMQEAKQRLEKAQREGALEAEKQALEELRQIEKELEELLRQLREEEMKRLLEYLEARFKKMLEMQIAVYEGTLRLDRVPEDERGRGEEIQAGRLSRQESLILLECDKALQLLREDGSAVALPEAVGQMREDIQQVVVWLSQMKIGPMTQGVEEDIITSLEEIIAALQKAQKDLEEQQRQQQQPPPSEGQPQEPPLIDMLAELKMLRSLQLRVNNRTVRYSEQLENPADEIGQAQQDELIQALKDLAQREQRIFEATRDIVTGRNR